MVTTENGVIKSHEEIQQLSFIRADELETMELEKPLFIVEDMLPVGLCFVASPPKYGKSWFVLDMCISAATGTKFLGHKTSQCGVLYLALEDSNNRLQDRMKKVLNGRKVPQDFAMSIRAADLGHGLIEQLSKFIEQNPRTKLIVIDTFQKIRTDMKRGESAYTADYREVGTLKTFADTYKIALVLVHHTKKMRDISDTFANISGTMGLTGAADTMIVMSKEKREDEYTKLSLTGRDIEMQEYQMNFNKECCRWHILGTADEVEERRALEEYNSNPLVLTIRKLLQQNRDGWTGGASEIINASRMFKTPVRDKAQSLGKSIAKVQDLLFQQDDILYEPIKNGTGASKHKFYYGYNPFIGENR